MPRPERVVYENALYHIVARGNRDSNIFISADDRKYFISLLADAAAKYCCKILCYCLMDTHYHLALRTDKANLSDTMQWLQWKYSRYFNNRYAASGHLFSGRFRSFLVKDDKYLTTLSFYIHCNPCLAGASDRIEDPDWSSYSFYALGRSSPSWLDTESVLEQFAAKPANQKARYQQSFLGIVQSRRFQKNKETISRLNLTKKLYAFFSRIRKNSRIQKRMDKEIPPAKILQCVKIAYNKNNKEITHKSRGKKSEARSVAIYLFWKHTQKSNAEIAKFFGATSASISMTLKRFKTSCQSNPSLGKRIDEIENMLIYCQ